MKDRPRWGIRTALLSFTLSAIVTLACILIWPSQTIEQCTYAYDHTPPEGLIYVDGDLTGCDQAIAEAAAAGSLDAALLGASYFSVYKYDHRKMIYYERRAVALGGNAVKLQLSLDLLLDEGMGGKKNCPEILAMLKDYRMVSRPPKGDELSVYPQEKGELEDCLAACASFMGKTNTGSGHAIDKQ